MKLRHDGFRISTYPRRDEVWFQITALRGDPADALKLCRLFDPDTRGTFYQTFLIISALRNPSYVGRSEGNKDGDYQTVTLVPNARQLRDRVVLGCRNWDPFFTAELFGKYDSEEYATRLVALGFVRVEDVEEEPTLPT